MALEQTNHPENRSLYRLAGIACLLAMSANLLYVILGFGNTEIIVYGTKTSTEWFSIFQMSWFKGLYSLGILNMVYMSCMIPVYLALVAAHNRTQFNLSALAMVVFLLAVAVYLSTNAAIPMFVLSGKFAEAATDAQRTILAAAGEAILARGEDFTLGSFLGLFLGGIAAITISFVMLRGDVFEKATAWIGIVGFTFLSLFTVISTFNHSLYIIAYYSLAMVGGVLALAWFVLVAIRFFKIVPETITTTL